jgi:hypothetical protein
MNRLVILPLLLALALATCKPHARWHQKLTLVVDTPAGEVSGSSVIRVAFSGKNRIILRDLDSPHLSMRGEAAMVEVLPGRWLFALLKDQDELIYNYVQDHLIGDPVSLEDVVGLEESIPLILDQTEPLMLDPKARHSIDYAARFPILMTFDDITDPKTARQVDPLNLAATFGSGVSLTAATVEVTDEPVTVGRVEGVLGWLTEVWPNQLDGQSLHSSDAEYPFANALSANSFSTEISK